MTAAAPPTYDDVSTSDVCCPVCLEPYNYRDRLPHLMEDSNAGCGHTFCAGCLIAVKATTGLCALCREEICNCGGPKCCPVNRPMLDAMRNLTKIRRVLFDLRTHHGQLKETVVNMETMHQQLLKDLERDVPPLLRVRPVIEVARTRPAGWKMINTQNVTTNYQLKEVTDYLNRAEVEKAALTHANEQMKEDMEALVAINIRLNSMLERQALQAQGLHPRHYHQPPLYVSDDEEEEAETEQS